MRMKLFCLIGLVSISLTGCGGGGGSGDKKSVEVPPQQSTNLPGENRQSLKVVDGYVVGAKVLDATSKVLGTTQKGGLLNFDTKSLNYPLFAKGGFVDLDNDGVYSGYYDILLKDSVVFSTNKGYVISPLTTLIQNGVDEEKLKRLIGLDSKSELYADPIEQKDVKIIKANQIAYAIVATGSIKRFAQNIEDFDSSGGIDEFANIAKESILDADALNFITEVVNSSSLSLENELKSIKNSILQKDDTMPPQIPVVE